MSYWTFSDIVEEIGAPLVQFAGVFGVTLAAPVERPGPTGAGNPIAIRDFESRA